MTEMYVFYDINGDIKAIAPSLKDFHDSTCQVTPMPLSTVEDFLIGKKNTFDYRISKVKGVSGEKFKLVKKVVEVNYLRSLDSYLTEILPAAGKDVIISITNRKSRKEISVELAKGFKEMYNHGNDEQRDSVEEFMSLGRTAVHITRKHNPYHLLFSFNFTAHDLFSEKALYFKYTDIIEDSSAYTKKIINGYSYRETN